MENAKIELLKWDNFGDFQAKKWGFLIPFDFVNVAWRDKKRVKQSAKGCDAQNAEELQRLAVKN